jgi:NAD(P)-dependent dehydrogenase (short-subunit alcohol dehydrogenase family)
MTTASQSLSQDKRIAFVTGASRGIGRAAAMALATAGHHVILSARTTGALEELDDEIRAAGGSASILPLDLTDGATIDILGPSLFERWEKLDVLVAAAGALGRLGPLAHTEDRHWNNVMAVNLTANWRLIRTLDPLLRRSEAGRAIFVTSGAARGALAYWGAYAVSKAGLEALVATYAAEVATTAVRVNLLDPGVVRTAMRAEAFPGENPVTLKAPETLAPVFLDLASPACTRNGELVIAP